jgi:antirestriction protein ArdC
MAQTNPTTFDFATLLEKAVSEPGLISRAYSLFHGYSIGNQLLALVQCFARGIEPGPIATFLHWKALGRSVRKGEKAIVLCMPVTCKRRSTDDAPEPDEQPQAFTRFIYRPHWFVLSQTDGATFTTPAIAGWDTSIALTALGVTEEPFTMTDGNCQGYARQRSIAVSPIAELPHKTRFHELAHVVLGHTTEHEMTDGEHTPRSIREVEAEAVALVCLEALGLAGAEHCRGYIQHWNARNGHAPIAERSAQKIFKAADTILRAGRVVDDAVDADLLAA